MAKRRKADRARQQTRDLDDDDRGPVLAEEFQREHMGVAAKE